MQVTCAIGYLHSTEIGIVHRDIKLANLLLTDRNIEQADVKLADFGLSVDMKRVKAVNKRHARIASWKYQTLSTQTRKNLSPWLQSAGMQRKMTDPMPTRTKTTATTATSMNCTSWIKRQMSSKRDRRSADETDDLLYYNLTEETGSYMYMSPEVPDPLNMHRFGVMSELSFRFGWDSRIMKKLIFIHWGSLLPSF